MSLRGLGFIPDSLLTIACRSFGVNTLLFYTGSVRWHKHDSKNCYDGHGATNMVPNPFSKAISLSDCQAACEADENCEGIVVDKGQEASGRCFKRRNIEPSKCQSNHNNNLWIKSTGMH